MGTTGEHPAVTEEKPPTVADMVQALPRKIFTREAALWIVALLLGGVAFAQGMERLDGGMEKRVAPLEKRVEAVEGGLADVQKTSAEALRVSMETNLNVRLIAERLKIQPITIEPTDAGR
jgi:hypothetical protein